MRRSRDFFNNVDKIYKKNIYNFINAQLNCVRVFSIKLEEKDLKLFLKTCYFKEFQKIIVYLTFLK